MKEVAGNLKTFNDKLREIYHNEPRPQHLNLSLVCFFVIEQNVNRPKKGHLEPRGFYSFWNRWVK